MTKGNWIVISGLDGTGKTTLKRDLVWYLRSRNKSVQDFKLPYDKHLLELLNVVGDGLPLKDNYTDRMLFTLDNRIVGTVLVPKWKQTYDVLVSQRGFLDSFVHGSVQGFTYEEINKMNRTSDLAKCDAIIHLNADPEVAYRRIKDDPDADKFETLEYIKRQAEETEKAYKEVLKEEDPNLASFFGIPHIYVDTTHLTTDETFETALRKLKENGIIDID